MSVVQRPGKNVRIIMDSRYINQFIQRRNVEIPSPEVCLSQLTPKKLYLVMDASSAFWQIKSDSQSADLLTMATLHGPYRFLRLAYGVYSAPEVFASYM